MALVIRPAMPAEIEPLRARAAGFGRGRLGAPLSGDAFYRRGGYVEIGRESAALPDGSALAVILMEKVLSG
jgi:hypothetical protein